MQGLKKTTMKSNDKLAFLFILVICSLTLSAYYYDSFQLLSLGRAGTVFFSSVQQEEQGPTSSTATAPPCKNDDINATSTTTTSTSIGEIGDSEHDEELLYLNTAKNTSGVIPVTDKVTAHTYQIMYGQYLLPYYRKHPKMKLLEIGLGCDMGYGPGASVSLYKKLFPTADLWEAEYDAACVKKALENGMLNGFNTLVGDQGNSSVLDKWIEESGGNFDVIIDDGGHQNCQIWTSFLKLWPTLKPGGLYFIEDMQVAKMEKYKRASSSLCGNDTIVPEKLKDVFDDLMYDTTRKADIKFMFCQSEACVLGKK